MGRLETVGYWENLIVPTLSLAQLDDFSLDIQRVLAHPDVGILDPKVVGGKDVLIAEQFTKVLASSAYAYVVYMTASASNGDFTNKWRTIPLSPDPRSRKFKKEEAMLKEFKITLARVAAEILVAKWFPEMIGVKYGVNIWPIRADGAFVVVPTS